MRGGDAKLVSAAELMAMLGDGQELALLDVREELDLLAVAPAARASAPLSRLELRVPRLVPRQTTRIVLVDDGDGLAERARQDPERAMATRICSSSRGVSPPGAKPATYCFPVSMFPARRLARWWSIASGTPSIDALELKRMIDSGEDMIVVDSRPFDEFTRVSIPAATNVPGAELVLRVPDLGPVSAAPPSWSIAPDARAASSGPSR